MELVRSVDLTKNQESRSDWQFDMVANENWTSKILETFNKI